MDIKKTFEEFQDYLAPKLDTYEQAIYLYVFRHSRLMGKDEAAIGFKSSRRKMSFGIGEKGKPMAEGTCYEKLRSLQKKGCVDILDVVREGTRVRLRLPSEIPGVLPAQRPGVSQTLEEMDFFTVPENRLAILKREGGKCFYCLRAIDSSNYVIEHSVLPGHAGNNTYKNVVAACRSCNNRKGKSSAGDFLRSLYRNCYLSEDEFEGRMEALKRLSEGNLRPIG